MWSVRECLGYTHPTCLLLDIWCSLVTAFNKPSFGDNQTLTTCMWIRLVFVGLIHQSVYCVLSMNVEEFGNCFFFFWKDDLNPSLMVAIMNIFQLCYRFLSDIGYFFMDFYTCIDSGICLLRDLCYSCRKILLYLLFSHRWLSIWRAFHFLLTSIVSTYPTLQSNPKLFAFP